MANRGCPFCDGEREWKEELEKNQRALPQLELSDCKVKVNGSILDFKEAIFKFLDTHYPNIEKEVFAVPSSVTHTSDQLKVVFEYLHKADSKLDNKNKIEKALRDIRDTEAVALVAEMLCRWAKSSLANGVCVFTEYKFESYLIDLKHTLKERTEVHDELVDDTEYKAEDEYPLKDPGNPHSINDYTKNDMLTKVGLHDLPVIDKESTAASVTEQTGSLKISRRLSTSQETNSDEKQGNINTPSLDDSSTNVASFNSQQGQTSCENGRRQGNTSGESESKTDSQINKQKHKRNSKDSRKSKKKDYKSQIYYFGGDHDIIAFSVDIGVVAIQVKSTKEDSNILTFRDDLKKAWKQVLKDHDAFLQMNRDKMFVKTLPFHRFVAMTSLTASQIDRLGICKLHKSTCDETVILRDHLIGNASTVANMLDNKFPESVQKIPAFEKEQYIELCGRYIGLTHSVATTIDTVAKNVKAHGVMLLTPQQRNILKFESPVQILAGDYGTGKSQLMCSKAEELLKRSNEKKQIIYYLSFWRWNLKGKVFSGPFELDLWQRMKETLPISDTVDKTTGNILYIKEYYLLSEIFGHPVDFNWGNILHVAEQFHELHKSEDVLVHMFLDEFPVPENPEEDDMARFCSVLAHLPKKYPNSLHWFALNTTFYASQTGPGQTSMGYGGDRLDEKLREKLKLPQDSQTLDYNYLTKVMRMTKNTFKILQYTRKFFNYDEDQACGSNLYVSAPGHVIEGLKPVLYCLPNCSCQPEASEEYDPIKCTCLEKRFLSVYEKVKRIHLFKKCKRKEYKCFFEHATGEDTAAGRGALVPFVHNIITKLGDESFESFCIGGPEYKLVVFFCLRGGFNRGLPHQGQFFADDLVWAVSRSLSQVVIIRVPDREQDTFVKLHVKDYAKKFGFDESYYFELYEKKKHLLKALVDDNLVELHTV